MKRLLCALMCLLLLSGTAAVAAGIPSANPVKITDRDRMVVIRVTYATAEFDEGFGGVTYAVPVKDTDCYALYDVVIYSDRMCLYKFPGDICQAETEYINGHPGWTDYEVAWRAFRDAHCLKTVKVNSSPSDPTRNSARRLKAYKAFFGIVRDKAPSRHVAVKYSGHNGGRQFCQSLSEKDTARLLKYGVKLFGQKFAFIDFGSNCSSGITGTLDFYAPYADYMLVSQLDYGGWEWDEWDGEAFQKTDVDAVYHSLFVSGETVEKAVLRLGRQYPQRWPYGKKYMRKHRIPQSVTVVKMTDYQKLMAKSTGSGGWADLYLCVKKTKKSSLMKLYNKAFIYYANNKKQLGSWKRDYGYGVWFSN